jgi:hypothetical protein
MNLQTFATRVLLSIRHALESQELSLNTNLTRRLHNLKAANTIQTSGPMKLTSGIYY